MFVSVVVPVFRCGPCLVPLYRRLTAVLSDLNRGYEIIFVNDASPDESAGILEELAGLDPRVMVISLPTNRGQHSAIAAGLAECRGEHAVVMDGDLEDPPEAIPMFLTQAESGYDIVLGVRSKRTNTFMRWLASRLFRVLVAPYRSLPNHPEYGALSLISQRARLRYLTHTGLENGYLVVLDRLALPYKLVFYRPEKRHAGRSAYTWTRLLRTALSIASRRTLNRPSSKVLTAPSAEILSTAVTRVRNQHD